MIARTCPHCGFRYTLSDYTGNLLLKMVWDEWPCKSCHELITFNIRRRSYVALFFGIWLALILILKGRLVMTTIWWILVIFLFLSGTVAIFSFDSFKKPGEDNSKRGDTT